MKQAFLIPLYNHGKALYALASRLEGYGLPILIVDDGSDDETQRALAETLAAFPNICAMRLKKNSGKGAAFKAGLKKAKEMGLSHVLQVDADGQHDTERAGFFLEMSAKRPEAAICGFPVFDKSAPALRKKGRNVSNVWARIVSLSGELVDSLCGFRVYPVEETLRIMQRHRVDKRMAFDPEILVRLSWAGVPLLFYAVKVSYPLDGISHFRMLRDNARISWVYTRLFFGMLLRLPLLLLRKIKKPPSSSIPPPPHE